MIDISPSGIKSSFSQVPVNPNQEKRMKIREFVSWSVCFAVISGLTGLMLILNVGITVASITSILFYSSLAGLAYCISRIIQLYRDSVQLNNKQIHELN